MGPLWAAELVLRAGAQTATLPPGQAQASQLAPSLVHWGTETLVSCCVQSLHPEKVLDSRMGLKTLVRPGPNPSGARTHGDAGGWSGVTLPLPDKPPILFQLDRGGKVAALRIAEKKQGPPSRILPKGLQHGVWGRGELLPRARADVPSNPQRRAPRGKSLLPRGTRREK